MNWPFSISAFSVSSECKVPSDLRGGICLPSDLLCFIKVQNLFIQFGLSFVWSLSGGETILSMHFQYAFLISLCVCRLSSLNLASSLLFLDFFLPFIQSIPLSYKTLDVWCYPWTTIFFPCNFFGYIYVDAFLQFSLEVCPHCIYV